MLIIPTHTNPPTLGTLLTKAGMPSIIVRTRPGLPNIGDTNLDDHGPINIHRWWNAGIQEAETQGATAVVIANHDIDVTDDQQLPKLIDALKRTGATIAYPAPTDTPVCRAWTGRRIAGWCFALNITHGLRPPEQYRWWYGDDWLDLQATRHHQGTVGIKAGIAHDRGGALSHPPNLTGAVRTDRATWVRERAN